MEQTFTFKKDLLVLIKMKKKIEYFVNIQNFVASIRELKTKDLDKVLNFLYRNSDSLETDFLTKTDIKYRREHPVIIHSNYALLIICYLFQVSQLVIRFPLK